MSFQVRLFNHLLRTDKQEENLWSGGKEAEGRDGGALTENRKVVKINAI
jgi:hypothetical protein